MATLLHGAQTETLDVLALAAHPDDVELCAGGTICTLVAQGYAVGIVDFTRGELGSRGTPEGRMEEATRAAEIMGLAVRENLGLPDGDIANTKANQRAVIAAVRRYQPRIVLINSATCRHPDHCAAAQLATDALYYSGLRKVDTTDRDGTPQAPHRPAHVLHYMQAIPFEPTLVVDVSAVWERRIEALQAFRSQFFNEDYTPDADEPETFISNPDFFEWIEGRARTYGYNIGATYGEPFLYRHGPLGVDDLGAVLAKDQPFR
ncbi:bacillithiol biosynthesis deacetylase BshB1 [Salisaeta longa]|uniref:bacillithiol biosynthesis deacetylase BshB1 n=1 Tax=Salisaeta longa TaxID=503170 RepID=UPI0003B3CD53|nr:bacillithiol biosynthesis deacetylase BshB1 [Salisaeta longa]